MLKNHIKESGCRNPYHTGNDTFPICDTKEKMDASKFYYKAPKNLGIPEACQRITKLRLEGASFIFYPHIPNEVWRFTILYPEYLRIITQSKEVDIHSLIGNIGGYLGLFLGKPRLLLYY